jgi:hypothetical protein
MIPRLLWIEMILQRRRRWKRAFGVVKSLLDFGCMKKVVYIGSLEFIWKFAEPISVTIFRSTD